MDKQYWIGTSGWQYKHWDGRFYPEDLPQKEWFTYYAGHYRTVEINSTFYRWPAAATIRKWYEKSPDDFKFTLKAPRVITHSRRLKDVGEQVRDFYRLSEGLEDKMACYLFQLPPQYKYDEIRLERLKVFLSQLDPERENVIEFRDPAWWNPDIYRLLKEHRVAFCIVYGLHMPDTAVLTTDFAYLRFHGERYDTRYTQEEIEDAAALMARMNGKKHYVYFNNDGHAFAVANAKELIQAVAP